MPMELAGPEAEQTVEAVRRAGEAHLRLVAEQAPAILWSSDLDLRFTALAGAGLAPFAQATNGLVGLSLYEYFRTDDRELPAIAAHLRALRGEPAHYQQAWDGRDFECHVEPLRGADGTIIGTVGLALDITERKAFEARLLHQAHHDPLTGLPNRTLFLDQLKEALATAARQQRVAVLYLDLDGFKLINDSLGHETGDRLLVDVGKRLQEGLPSGAILARFGGDEFAILLAGVVDGKEATHVAEHVLQALRTPFRVNGHEAFVTATIGIAISGARRTDPSDLLREADTALYEAKAVGPAASAVYAPSMRAPLVQRLERQSALGRALERGELRLRYQPKVELATGRVIGAEALVRWEHPEHGLLPPADFIRLAEDTGLIIPLGQWVLREACSEASRWLTRGADKFSVSVNLSSRQLHHPDLISDVMQALETSRLNPSRLELEITEDVAMAYGRETQRRLQALKKLGVGITIDDFGTGYSSLAYLRTLPVDAIKIDRIFVAELDRDAGSQAIVRAVTTLARDLGLTVTAEGVETAEQAAWLRGIDVDLAQGYYFAPPLTSDVAADLLAQEARLPEGSDGANAVSADGTAITKAV
jgi:diguanylate cyclase (GGDEF)-like protein/PAS domain S-box-containing protein